MREYHSDYNTTPVMKNFAEYSVEEFAAEPAFIKWVQHPDDDELSNFWVVWLHNHPFQSETVDQARLLVRSVSDQYTDALSSNEKKSLWGRIIHTITTPETSTTTIQPAAQQSSTLQLLLLAIVLAIACLSMWAFIN
jgi:hypothetical protein